MQLEKVKTSPKTVFAKEFVFFAKVCLSFFTQDKLKSSELISLQFCRILGYRKRNIKLKFEKNHFDRVQTANRRQF